MPIYVYIFIKVSIKAAGVNTWSSNSPCYWSGTSPFCQGSCNKGIVMHIFNVHYVLLITITFLLFIGEFPNATSTKGDGILYYYYYY